MFFIESRYTLNYRSFDIIIPWEKIRSFQTNQIKELELISKWISDNTKNDEIIFSEYDHIRYFSKRALLGSKELPQKIDLLEEWYFNRMLYENFIKDPLDEKNLSLIKELKVKYIVLPESIETIFEPQFSTKNIKVIKIR